MVGDVDLATQMVLSRTQFLSVLPFCHPHYVGFLSSCLSNLMILMWLLQLQALHLHSRQEEGRRASANDIIPFNQEIRRLQFPAERFNEQVENVNERKREKRRKEFFPEPSLISFWTEWGHMATFSCKRSWEADYRAFNTYGERITREEIENGY